MRNVYRVALMLGLVASTMGCAGPGPASTATLQVTAAETASLTPANVDISAISNQDYPRVDGSTSTFPLQVMIACTILEVECAWKDGDIFDTTRRIAPVEELLAFEGHETIFNLFHNGTHGAYVNLIEDLADLILVAREPSGDELSAARDESVELETSAVALDAFVFLMHVDNPVKSLTLDQIREIYSGRINNWSEVGGVDAEIHTYQRNPNSGSQELMEELVMRGDRMLDSPDMILMSMMGPFSAIRDDPLGIGYSVYFYAANIFPEENVKLVAIDGVGPSSETIATRDYPLVTEVYAVIRTDTHLHATARLMRDWLLTPAGQEAVAASGYVGMAD